MIHLEIAGPVARLTFDRPEVLNGADAPFVGELGAAVAEIGARPGVRVAVMTGAGRAFQTGIDLNAFAAGAMGLPHLVAWEDAMTAIERMDVLWVAGINGHCIGGGLQLALVCDYRLAAEGARIGLPAVKECLIPSMAPYRLPRLIGLARAKELILLGHPIDAREAERFGLVNRVVPDARFAEALEETVERFLALPPASAAANKHLTARAFDLPFDAFRAEMQARLAACIDSDEHRRAMADWRARKAPRG